jgi:hypothetical protein
MIEQLFRQARAPFIVVRNQLLHIGDREYKQLKVYIHELTPVRKLFNEGKLQCYSLDCRTAKNGRLCELCPDRHHCSRRLQLRLAYLDADQQKPAILEMHRNWFAAFDNLLESVPTIDDLPHIPLTIIPVLHNGHTDLEFQRRD